MSFAEWLRMEMEQRDVSRRELARRMAESHRDGVTPQTVETYRRAIRRYLDADDPQVPKEQTREAIADALGVDRGQLPDDEDEEVDLNLALLRACRRRFQMSDDLKDWIRWGIRNGVFDEIPISELERKVPA